MGMFDRLFDLIGQWRRNPDEYVVEGDEDESGRGGDDSDELDSSNAAGSSGENEADDADLREMPLSEALALHSGDLVAAMQALRWNITTDDTGNVVELYSDRIRGEIELLSPLKSLRALILSFTEFGDEALRVLYEFPLLEKLSIECARSHPLTEAALDHLAGLPKLREFELDTSNASGSGLCHIQSPERMEKLSIDRSPFSYDGFLQIGRFHRLTELRLGVGVKICDEAMRLIAQLPLLRSLDLVFNDSTKLTDRGVAELARHPSLETITFGHNAVTDACIDTLLTIPNLKVVTFQNRQISVSGIVRLRERGLEVSHGLILGLRRSDNYLRCEEMDFAIDPEKSYINAILDFPTGRLAWAVTVTCASEYIPESWSPPVLEGPPIEVSVGWRKLDGLERKIHLEDCDPLPGNPGNFDMGWHRFPNDHTIRFSHLGGRRFKVEWSCSVRGDRKTERLPIYVSGEFRLNEIIISHIGVITERQAFRAVSRYFGRGEFGDPETFHYQTLHVFRFPILIDD